ncbi:hypothetical protein F7R91_27825 [Streptomyces luteolifulvus]|uniref:Uncharacterized protein n=1 Tax=Streptomyces luteolifulvus TaxID=2615112 RepID=A0A6H9UTJ6_9ACTN|nr:hypothetical protein F7R91_27825 [Streptomyces luteolifulvus]
MATILAHGVAASSMSGYCARPDSTDHEAYGIGHVLYSRTTPVGHRTETDERPHTGHSPAMGPAHLRRARSARHRGWCEHLLGVRRADATRPR